MITLKKIKAEFDQLVDKYGADYVYRPETESCLYVDNTGGCIVGRWFREFRGITEEQLKSFNEGVGAVLACSALDIKDVSLPAQKFLVYVQNYQDAGSPWGASVARAYYNVKAEYPYQGSGI